ncbi:MAG: hypothetical protein MZU95_03140 [Desulfomicrobium escambiense]|nr:hypothetical protein [Desulfomicrobium escambiense]
MLGIGAIIGTGIFVADRHRRGEPGRPRRSRASLHAGRARLRLRRRSATPSSRR